MRYTVNDSFRIVVANAVQIASVKLGKEFKMEAPVDKETYESSKLTRVRQRKFETVKYPIG